MLMPRLKIISFFVNLSLLVIVVGCTNIHSPVKSIETSSDADKAEVLQNKIDQLEIDSNAKTFKDSMPDVASRAERVT
jgi:hypothetical protein